MGAGEVCQNTSDNGTDFNILFVESYCHLIILVSGTLSLYKYERL